MVCAHLLLSYEHTKRQQQRQRQCQVARQVAGRHRLVCATPHAA